MFQHHIVSNTARTSAWVSVCVCMHIVSHTGHMSRTRVFSCMDTGQGQFTQPNSNRHEKHTHALHTAGDGYSGIIASNCSPKQVAEAAAADAERCVFWYMCV